MDDAPLVGRLDRGGDGDREPQSLGDRDRLPREGRAPRARTPRDAGFYAPPPS